MAASHISGNMGRCHLTAVDVLTLLECPYSHKLDVLKISEISAKIQYILQLYHDKGTILGRPIKNLPIKYIHERSSLKLICHFFSGNLDLKEIHPSSRLLTKKN